jgi:hypothetical protein
MLYPTAIERVHFLGVNLRDYGIKVYNDSEAEECSAITHLEQPGPPLSQMIRSLTPSTDCEGKYQKKSSRDSSVILLMGKRPAHEAPTSNPTSGIVVPFT